MIESGGEPPEWAEDVAGVPGLSPGQSITVTRTLEPGSYVFLCFFPDPEGTPHANLGMYELFTIAGDTGAALPEPDATITATDDGLQVPALASGEQTVEFENGGTKPHELALVAFEPGKGIKDVDRWFGSGYQGEPPVTFLGGMQTIPAGESVFLANRPRAGGPAAESSEVLPPLRRPSSNDAWWFADSIDAVPLISQQPAYLCWSAA